MNFKKSIIISLVLSPLCALSQNKPLVTKNIDQVLNTIDSYSPSLKALQKQTEATKSEAFTGNAMSNPTVEFNYLWGNNESDRYDINVTQEMEFPTVYIHRRKLANGNADAADINYLIGRREILSEAASLCVELAFALKKGDILQEIASSAEKAENATQKSFNNGETNAIELSKAQIHHLNAKNEVNINNIEINQLTEQLMLLCGDIPYFSLEADDLPTADSLPVDFESWYKEVECLCPEILLAMQNVSNSQLNLKMQKAQWAPNLAIGYVSEHTSESTLQGVSLGISIPLYERRKTIRTARSQQAVAIQQLTTASLQIKSQLKATYNKAIALFSNASMIEEAISKADARGKALTALENGEIDMFQYCQELDDYYAMLIQLNDIKKEATLLAEQLLINKR